MKNSIYLFKLSMVILTLTGPMAAGAQSDAAVDAGQLQQALAERDEIIIDLLDRVDALERRLAALEPSTAQPRTDTTAAGGNTGADGNRDESGSGGLIVDELAAERALERGLVQQGVRLLRAGQIQLAPSSSYARVERRSAAPVQRETEIFDFSVLGRLGLPFNAQLEINLPYRKIDVTRKILDGDAIRSVTGDSGSGVGNVSIGVAARLLQQSNWVPELLGRITWLTGSGDEEDNGISLGGGYSGFGFDLNATWRRDPVVFLMGAGYFRYDDDDLQPGDSVNLSVGASLALSPETAMTVTLDQRFSDDFKLDGRPLPGTDQVASLLNISTSTLVGRGSLLQVNAGIGLTPDAPDYLLGVSLPFDAGFLW